uniref:Uncharacterized protein orf89 n=1 Tax=Chaetosphaeridium globosum TaxID=96477 RepID=Q8M9T3_CHAGL|nr:hypothetical protein ChglCp094 [Chaetosphaeridium globosum]AAM96593.1 hypothetical protein [Chaetosphaeridium globosum]
MRFWIKKWRKVSFKIVLIRNRIDSINPDKRKTFIYSGNSCQRKTIKTTSNSSISNVVQKPFAKSFKREFFFFLMPAKAEILPSSKSSCP